MQADDILLQAAKPVAPMQPATKQEAESPLRVYVYFFLALNLSALSVAGVAPLSSPIHRLQCFTQHRMASICTKVLLLQIYVT